MAMTKRRIQRVSSGQITMPVGTAVKVRLDDGSSMDTKTRGVPWQLGHGDWVVSVEGISGGYDLERVTIAPQAEA